jgi:hypothetical protein
MTKMHTGIPYAGQLGVTNGNVKVVNNSASTLLLV